MTNVRDMRTEEQVDREALSIKNFLKKNPGETIRIEWGTPEAMEAVRKLEFEETVEKNVRSALGFKNGSR